MEVIAGIAVLEVCMLFQGFTKIEQRLENIEEVALDYSNPATVIP
jgi:hypothetical protein